MPPGLRFSLPFYAHKDWVKLGEPIRLFEYLQRTYGSIAHYRFMGTPIIFVTDPAYIQEILVTQGASFVKERTVRRMKILLGEGLITSDDPIHIRNRRIVAPAFHRQRIAAYADEIVSSSANHIASWNDGETLDISASMMSLSLEIVARTLFHTKVTDDIRRINDEVNAIMEIYNFLVAFPRMETVLDLPFPVPIPKINAFRRSKARLDEVVNRLIAEHRSTGEDRGDLLSMLIASRDEDGSALSDQQIRDEVLTIFLAGYETTANALAWTWYLLSQNPEAEARLHAELDAVLGTPTNGIPSNEAVFRPDTHKNGVAFRAKPQRDEAEEPPHFAMPGEPPSPNVSSRPEREARSGGTRFSTTNPSLRHRLPTLADYPALRYTEQVFAESMRLYPPAWAMGRMSIKPVTLGPYRIPAGAHFFMSQYIVSRRPELFPDPLRFDPDRFTPEARAARPRFAYFPFGAGSRQCIGENFAWMEGVLSIATIASRWRMDYLGTTTPVPQAKITLRPRDPVMMRLHPR
ncbi:MAG: cytochrome P450 [Edaphobacter sp.]|uniref:cytochrome P450 n=1 Tax=Edaphobacter sp. TaxID=1934404 RepID=UPI0023A4D660|nr:cytochrome P450 [Edaphobacter sp.]MDE1178307.1 cytochrome P450 [Edaphobacter sp.]